MKTCCTVVIGHVDHGKTSLVRALTGTDTDRLPEEKARGLSITNGFAYCTYDSGIIDLVDAPGHKDFIQAMISGASGAQAALIVISLVDGVCEQTLEHLRIAALLGISQAIIAITKADTCPSNDRPKQLAKIKATLSQTPYAKAPLIVCSAQSGEGIEVLNRALENLLQRSCLNVSSPYSFLPIDRSFNLTGKGTVVTGTLLGQAITSDDRLVLQPQGREVSIRSLQSRGSTRDHVQPGERMAANLRGINPNDIARGSVLCTQGLGAPTQNVDVHLEILPKQTRRLKHMQDVRILFGASSAVAQLRLFKGGNQGFAQLRFSKPVVCFAGQVGILRCLSPSETIGKAVFLDPQAIPTGSGDRERLNVLEAAQKGDPNAIADALIKQGNGVAKAHNIAKVARLRLDDLLTALSSNFQNLNDDYLSSQEQIESAKEAVLQAIAQYHDAHPLRSSAPRKVIDLRSFAQWLLNHVEDKLVADGILLKQANKVALVSHNPMKLISDAQRRVLDEIETAYQRAGINELALEAFPKNDETAELTQLLIETKRLTLLHNVALNQFLIFHVDAITDAADTLNAVFPETHTFTTSQARVALGTSRKIIVPLLEHFDAHGMTVRDKDTRYVVPMKTVSQNHGT
ncbi:selenocysteine-specific translation elongation factor [Planktotalea sp.]|uniref:selenocysteine-specific translation elongation factor n=1 Tax=Planktotalea sp. TaxID=2029877 RepID=UPI003F6B7367